MAIIHPDLGIGGAEQLIINVALALQNECENGYDVTVYTPFFDPNRCFKEAREQLDVQVHGSWFPRSIFGRFIALCAYIRMMLCSIWVLLFGGHFDYYILDQVSFPIPLIRLRSSNVFFYCHYPDKLLSTDRRSWLKKIYRFFLDFIEEVTTGMAKSIVVNSKFTQNVFLRSFPLIARYRAYRPEVVYPSIDERGFLNTVGFKETIEGLLGKTIERDTVILTSLNRYERKKNIPLALESFAFYVKNGLKSGVKPLLVIAGGYDPRLDENVSVHEELRKRATELGIADKVVFLKSISNDQRILLLENTKILLYIPENEHFGIVPVEAMYMGCIALACNSGGPLESVEHGVSGYLMPPDPEVWGA